MLKVDRDLYNINCAISNLDSPPFLASKRLLLIMNISFVEIVVSPALKKPKFDLAILENYWFVSNAFSSRKVVEKGGEVAVEEKSEENGLSVFRLREWNQNHK